MAEGRAPQMFRVPGRDLSYVEAGHVTGVLANQEAGDTRPNGDVLLHEHSDDGGRSSTDVSSPARDLNSVVVLMMEGEAPQMFRLQLGN